MIKLAIADDNPVSLRTIEEKLSSFDDIHINYSAVNGAALLHLLEENSEIDLILMDIEMPVMNGIETAEKIKTLYPNIKIVMISIYDDDEYVFNAIKVGADGYILKNIQAGKLHETIVDTLKGGAVMSPSIASKALQLLRNQPLPDVKKSAENIILSERETEILEQLSKGFSNKVIADNLFISPFTVKRHIENIYRKLQVQNRIELLGKARSNGLID